MDEYLEYSYSNGKYWSKYNHCRVWENDTYYLLVRDKYGNTTPVTLTEITNNKKRELPLPNLDTGDYVEGTWTGSDVSLLATTDVEGATIYYSINGGTTWQEVSSPILCDKTSSFMFQMKDIYGNVGKYLTFNVNIDKSLPSNINILPTVKVTKDIVVEVSAINNDSPMRYSITYDNGQTWSPPQIGRFFAYGSADVGTYTINARVYNGSGNYKEGVPVEVKVN